MGGKGLMHSRSIPHNQRLPSWSQPRGRLPHYGGGYMPNGRPASNSFSHVRPNSRMPNNIMPKNILPHNARIISCEGPIPAGGPLPPEMIEGSRVPLQTLSHATFSNPSGAPPPYNSHRNRPLPNIVGSISGNGQ